MLTIINSNNREWLSNNRSPPRVTLCLTKSIFLIFMVIRYELCLCLWWATLDQFQDWSMEDLKFVWTYPCFIDNFSVTKCCWWRKIWNCIWRLFNSWYLYPSIFWTGSNGNLVLDTWRKLRFWWCKILFWHTSRTVFSWNGKIRQLARILLAQESFLVQLYSL